MNFYQASSSEAGAASSTTQAEPFSDENTSQEEEALEGGEVIFQQNTASNSATSGTKKQEPKNVTNIINNVRCHITYPTINYRPQINNNNINNFIIGGQPPEVKIEEDPTQFSQLSGLSYMKNG